MAEILASGQSVFLVGEPGVGKTATIGELVRRAHTEGEATPDYLVPIFEDAASALQEWERLAAEQSACALWLVVGNAAPLQAHGDWGDSLASLFPTLRDVWAQPPDGEPETARVYGEGGVARDRRSGVTSGRLKDVWKGRLDPLLEAWRRQADA